jgi:hypothetical protein
VLLYTVAWGHRWLLFRIMLGAGLIKVPATDRNKLSSRLNHSSLPLSLPVHCCTPTSGTYPNTDPVYRRCTAITFLLRNRSEAMLAGEI